MSSQRPVNDQDLERLSAYLDGELSAGERSALEARLQTDAGLRRELSLLRQTVALIQTAAPYKAPRDFTLTPKMVRARQPRVLLFPATALVSTLSAVAAIVLVLAGLTLLNLSSAPMASLVSESNGGRNRTNEQAQVANLPTSTTVLLPAPTLMNGIERAETTEARQPAQPPQNTDALRGGGVTQVEKTATALTTQLAYSTQAAANGEQAGAFVDEAADDAQETTVIETALPGIVSVQEDQFEQQISSPPPAEEISPFAEIGGGDAGGAGGEAQPEMFDTDQLPTDNRDDGDLTNGRLADASAANSGASPAQPQSIGRTATDASAPEMEAFEAPLSAQNTAPEPTMSTFGMADVALAVTPTSKPPTPAPTLAPTDTPTPLPSATPTNVPTDTPTLTPTATHTHTPAPTQTATPNPTPTATPVPPSAPAFSVSPGLLGFILIIVGIMAFGLFALTLAARRRNR